MEKLKSDNSGVHGVLGHAFQKHCALYMLLSNYDEYKKEKYFISVELHDDLIFCFLEDDIVIKVDAYQAKKQPVQWTLTKTFVSYVDSMLEVGKNILDDMRPKSADYVQRLVFISNGSMYLASDKPKKSESDRTTTSNLIDANTLNIKYLELDKKVKQKFVKNLILLSRIDLSELENLEFQYIDLPKTYDEQKNCLMGKCENVFGKLVPDRKAAVDTMIAMFTDVEMTLNNANKAALMDKSKQVDSDKINETFNFITEKALGYETWRELRKDISKGLDISISKQKNFAFHYENAFDLFKDSTQLEHLRILEFVEENSKLLDIYSDEADCIVELANSYQSSKTTNLEGLEFKAAIYAAYIKVRGINV